MFALIAIALLISNILAAPHVPQDARKVLLREPSPELLSDIEPTFLKEASEEAREEFEKIVNDESLTIGEVRSKMNEWASKQGGDVQAGLLLRFPAQVFWSTFIGAASHTLESIFGFFFFFFAPHHSKVHAEKSLHFQVM